MRGVERSASRGEAVLYRVRDVCVWCEVWRRTRALVQLRMDTLRSLQGSGSD